jgi:hypothetical protein
MNTVDKKQPLDALAKGNRIRLLNAQLKRSLSVNDGVESRRRAATIIEDLGSHHEGVDRMKVIQFLSSITWAGEVSVNRWLNKAGITPTRRFSECTARQLSVLVDELDDSANRMEDGRKQNGR